MPKHEAGGEGRAREAFPSKPEDLPSCTAPAPDPDSLDEHEARVVHRRSDAQRSMKLTALIDGLSGGDGERA